MKYDQAHDPQKALTALRDQLARHDKPIAFFFGAGTSCSVRIANADGSQKPLIPAVPGLTEICKEDVSGLGKQFETAWSLVKTHLEGLKADAHVENVLTHVRLMMSAVSGNDRLVGLNAQELKLVEECIRKTIARVVTPEIATLGADTPHRKLARWLAKSTRRTGLEIFTVNYDVLIEHALEAERVPVFDGFVGSFEPFFHPDSLRRAETAPGSNWTRLWKMHGSVTWRRTERDGRFRVVRGAADSAGEMIFPSSQKYDESRLQPFSAFTDRLARFLDQDDALLIVAGFSFADEHINNLIFGALENRPRTHVYALQFEEPKETDVLVARAIRRSNMIVIAPETGVIGGVRANWKVSDTPASLDGCYVTKETEVDGAQQKSIEMKIGDFARLSSFLEAMAS